MRSIATTNKWIWLPKGRLGLAAGGSVISSLVGPGHEVSQVMREKMQDSDGFVTERWT